MELTGGIFCGVIGSQLIVRSHSPAGAGIWFHSCGWKAEALMFLMFTGVPEKGLQKGWLWPVKADRRKANCLC